MINFVYDKAPGFAASEFENAFDLNEMQINQLDADLEMFFAWHRGEELERYQALLKQAALAIVDGISAAEFLRINEDLHQSWLRLFDKAIDSLGDLAATLQPEQIDRYRQYYRENSGEFEDYLEKSDQQREVYRIERSYARLETWFGNFDNILGTRIMARLQPLPDILGPWIKYRDARHQVLLEALTDAGVTRQRLKTIMLDSSTDYARAFEISRRAHWLAYAAVLEDISGWLSNAQRQRAVSRLQKFARIAERLKKQE